MVPIPSGFEPLSNAYSFFAASDILDSFIQLEASSQGREKKNTTARKGWVLRHRTRTLEVYK